MGYTAWRPVSTRLRFVDPLEASGRVRPTGGTSRSGGSYGATASSTLKLSVTAVTKLVTLLERDLEAKLFDRTSQGITLTTALAR